MPVLAVYGSLSNTGPGVEEMMHEVANDVTGVRIPDTAHWIAEENPGFFAAVSVEFLRKSTKQATAGSGAAN